MKSPAIEAPSFGIFYLRHGKSQNRSVFCPALVKFHQRAQNFVEILLFAFVPTMYARAGDWSWRGPIAPLQTDWRSTSAATALSLNARGLHRSLTNSFTGTSVGAGFFIGFDLFTARRV